MSVDTEKAGIDMQPDAPMSPEQEAEIRKYGMQQAGKLGLRTAGALVMSFFAVPIRDIWRPIQGVFLNDEKQRDIYDHESPATVLIGTVLKTVYYGAAAGWIASFAFTSAPAFFIGVPVALAGVAVGRGLSGMVGMCMTDNIGNEDEVENAWRSLFIDNRTGPLLKECAEMNNDWEAWATRKYYENRAIPS